MVACMGRDRTVATDDRGAIVSVRDAGAVCAGRLHLCNGRELAASAWPVKRGFEHVRSTISNSGASGSMAGGAYQRKSARPGEIRFSAPTMELSHGWEQCLPDLRDAIAAALESS